MIILTPLLRVAGALTLIAISTQTLANDCPHSAEVPDTVQMAPSAVEEAAITTPGLSEKIDQFIVDAMARHGVPGSSFALFSGGTIVHSQAYGTAGPPQCKVEEPAVSPASIFEGASMSKPLFGYFVMTFVDEGALELDRPLVEYVDDPAMGDDPRIAQITARMVLSHQTGLPNWRQDEPEAELNFAFDPGKGYRYSGEGYQYLSRALMAIAQTDDAGLDRIFQARVAVPMGLTATRFVPDGAQMQRKVTPSRDGEWIKPEESFDEFGAAYSIHSNAGDFARALIGMGKGTGLSPESHAAFLEGQGVALPADEPGRALGLVDWSLGFAVFDLGGRRIYSHGGNNPGWTSTSALDPGTLDGFVVFTNSDQENDFTTEVALFVIQSMGEGPRP